VVRGWDFNTLMAMSVQEFFYWLNIAIEAAKQEQAALEAASSKR